MNTSRPYVITGANGRTGSAAAQTLLDRGLPVRVVIRDAAKSNDWTAKGADVVIADLSDLDAMTAAFADARGVYVVSPQEYGRQDLFERAASIAHVVAKAAVLAGVPKVVALSSVGADQDRGAGWIAMNRTLEQSLMPLDAPTAFIRAAYFMENWTSLIGTAVTTGVLHSFLSPAERQIPMVAAADVGCLSASILLEDWHGKKIVDLAGPQPYAPADVARSLAEVTGDSIVVHIISEADWRSALSSAGFSEAGLQGFVEMTTSLNSAHIAFHGDSGSERRTGATTLSDAVATIAAKFSS